MAAENQQKHLGFTFSIKAPSFHSRTSIRAQKNISLYLEWLYCCKSRGDTFFQRDSIPILVSRTVKTYKTLCRCPMKKKYRKIANEKNRV